MIVKICYRCGAMILIYPESKFPWPMSGEICGCPSWEGKYRMSRVYNGVLAITNEESL